MDIKFGLMAKPIPTQLKEQNLIFDSNRGAELENIRQSILILQYNGIITDDEKSKFDIKLLTKIKQHVAKKNKDYE